MKFSKGIIILVFILVLVSLSSVSATDLALNNTDNLTDSGDSYIDSVDNSIYVNTNGKSSNDGSFDSPVNTLSAAISKAQENSTIYISSGEYEGVLNTRLVIDKSLNFIGSDNTIVNGQKLNYMFTISDGVSVTFKNIKFINSYKAPESYSASYNSNVYGSAIEIKKASVLVDNCSFMNSVLSYGTRDNQIYGGAISNFGDLTISNSRFINNTALSTSGLFSYGGAVYNKGKLRISNSSFSNSKSVDFGYGAAIANDGDLMMDSSIISNSIALHECKGSAIFNTGNFVLANSIVENNYIERANFNYIYGVIYNSGDFTAWGTVFRNNTGYYDNMPAYKGSPNIYNIGNLNVTYCAFMDNAEYDGISSDIYINGGNVISIDNNWWNTNENPYLTSTKINVDEINSWLMFNLIPDYSKLNISDSITLKALWTNNIDLVPKINLMPIFDVTFNTTVNNKEIMESKKLVNGSCEFIFTYTQNKGSYEVLASLGSFNQTALVDVGKTLSYLTFTLKDNITYLDDLIIDVEVIGADNGIPDGIVSLKIDGETYTVDLVKGKGQFVISDLTPNEYDVDIIYEGNDDYFKAFNKTTATVQKQDVNLSVNIPEIKVGQKGSIVVTLLPKGVQGQAILYVDGTRKKIVYLYNGDTTISLSNFAEGEYNITLEFVETTFYNSATISGILNVTRYDSSINISSSDINVGENATITIKPYPESLRGEATLIINGINETIFIDDAVTNITISNLNAGQYNVTLLFNGDLRYYPVNVSTSFKVLRTPTVLDVNLVQDEKNLNGTITVKTNNINCTGVVGVYVNYNLYKANLTDGKAEFAVKFDKGTNYVFVFYEGDRYYEGATWNTTIGVADEFIFIGENSTGFEGNNFNYSVRLIELTGIPMPNRVVSVEFDGKKCNVTTNDDGYAYFSLNLLSGVYTISATYKNSTVNNTLTVKSIDFNLTSSDVVYGEKEIIKAIFDERVSGKVNFIIGDLNEFVDIVNGTALYESSSLNVGNYTLKAIYSNDFTNLTKINYFKVEKANLTLNIDAHEATPYIDEIITVFDLKNATGDIIFIFNGTEYEIPITNSQAILNLSKLNEGNYSLAVKYSGDGNYNGFADSISFYIKEFASALTLTANGSVYGNDIIISAKLNSDATGIVRFNVGNLTKDMNIVDGEAVWRFTGLDVGNYMVIANYLGNAYYISSSNTTSLNISKANSTIELYVKEVSLDENIRIYANLSPNATGSVSFSMVGYFTPRNKPISDSKSSWYIAPLNTGQYIVIAKYAGDGNYYASQTTYLLNVSQRKSVLDVEIDDARISERVICKVSLKTKDGEGLTSKVILKIGSSYYTIDIQDGRGSLVIGKMNVGNYSYDVEYDGDENFTSSSYSGSFKVVDDLLDVNLTAKNLTKYYKGSEKLKITLKNSNGHAFANQVIRVKLNSKEYTVFTDSKGEAFLDVDLNPGKYTALVIFDETERYYESSISVSVVVLTTAEGVDIVKLYGSGTQYFAVFTDSNGKVLANTMITFKIGSNSYNVRTLANGVARININIKAGTYTISCTNPATGQKLTNKITIYYKIMENKDVSNYYGAKTTYKVRIYTDGKKPVGAGKVVTFKIGSKTYSVKTDNEGYAKLAIYLKPKKYTVTASYGGFKVSNKIIVKKVLTAKNISKKKSKKIKFSAKLVNTKGKPLKGKKITFKIKGKKYTAKTNKKGIATITIKLNLKKGTYKIYSIYGKSKIINKIKIK